MDAYKNKRQVTNQVSPDSIKPAPPPAAAPLPLLLPAPAGRGLKTVAPALLGSSDALGLASLAQAHGPIAVICAEPSMRCACTRKFHGSRPACGW